MSLEGHVENGVVVFDEPVSLPNGTPVRVEIVQVEKTESHAPNESQTAKELLTRFAGCMTDLPVDLARNHDHYLHGTPKR